MQFNLSKQYDQLRRAITQDYRVDEKTIVDQLLSQIHFTPEQEHDIQRNARNLIHQVRQAKAKQHGVDALMQEFSLGDAEGVALMCLAEALLRIPDNHTRDELIYDKLKEGNWSAHLGKSSSLFVNAASYGLLISGKLSRTLSQAELSHALTASFARLTAPVMRLAMIRAMKILGEQFVTGVTIEKALYNIKPREKRGFSFSFDMLGEAAMTASDAQRYFNDYIDAIRAVGKASGGKDIYHANGVSVKLSAIHPRYSRSQYDRVMQELYPRVKELCVLAKRYNIGLNIDAEEASRLELSLDLIDKLLSDPDLAGFDGIGFVVQAYSKRCPKVLDYLIALAREKQRKLMVRLVKGAYWDSEIKWAQTEGVSGFPLYTRKNHTDIAYVVCAQKLFNAQDVIYPQFATHNVLTLCTIYELGKGKRYEFQCLHGMGETLYECIVGKENFDRMVRVYAPVGTHETLLAYLVRRLLENGANSSFVHQLVDKEISVDSLLTLPWQRYQTSQGEMNRSIKLPLAIYPDRQNSRGFDLTDELELEQLETQLNQASIEVAHSLIAPSLTHYEKPFHPVFNPAKTDEKLSEVAFFNPSFVPKIYQAASQSQWGATSVCQRADILRNVATLYEQNYGLLMKLAVLEAGKTLPNAIAELREAVDFLRYYAQQAEQLAQKGQLASPLGTALCISPWNFPLAIFTGQLCAALVAGNAVVAKPAEQTSLIACAAIRLFYQAGVPRDALQLVLGEGDLGAGLVKQPFNAVIFTGSTEVAKSINTQLSLREDHPILIAETGGQNVLVVDSSALPEQVVADVLSSAFDSAGQRCSALRILLVQEEVVDHLYEMITQATKELTVGQPQYLATDIGPVIDAEALDRLNQHKQKMRAVAKRYFELPEPSTGFFVAPAIYELEDLDQLEREVFGPILHVVRYQKEQLGQLLDRINEKGYALTGGCHSRIRKHIDFVQQHLNCGNFYVNRNIVGAVVGVQPFGGHGLSGTGPKAGGEFYLQRLTQSKAYYSQFGRAEELVHLTPKLPSITGEENTLAYLPCEVALLEGDLEVASKAATTLINAGFRLLVEPHHPLASQKSDHIRVSGDLRHCQKGVYFHPITPEKRQWLAQHSQSVFKLYDWSQQQDIIPLFDEFSRSENTTAAGGNASLMAMEEE